MSKILDLEAGSALTQIPVSEESKGWIDEVIQLERGNIPWERQNAKPNDAFEL